MVFIDSNIFMYAVGKNATHKTICQSLLSKVFTQEIKAATNVEVLQEILYRFNAIHKSQLGFDLFDHILASFETILPVTLDDMKEAKKIQQTTSIKPRDAIHAATMKNAGIKTILTYDRDFDKIHWIKRRTPVDYL